MLEGSCQNWGCFRKQVTILYVLLPEQRQRGSQPRHAGNGWPQGFTLAEWKYCPEKPARYEIYTLMSTKFQGEKFQTFPSPLHARGYALSNLLLGNCASSDFPTGFTSIHLSGSSAAAGHLRSGTRCATISALMTPSSVSPSFLTQTRLLPTSNNVWQKLVSGRRPAGCCSAWTRQKWY